MKSPALQILENFAYEILKEYDPEFIRSDLAFDWPFTNLEDPKIGIGDPFRELVLKYWEKIEEIEY